jgi:hypothetical protein
LLLLVIPKVKNNQGILTGKFFEYLASQKPLLAIGPTDGDLAKIIGETGCGSMFAYDDGEGMHRFMTDTLGSDLPATGNGKEENAKAYSRQQLTGQIAQLLNA